MLKQLHIIDDDSELAPPKTRGECVNGPRPCPHLHCKYHTWPELLNAHGNSKTLRLPADSCVLDIADRGGTTLEGIGKVMGISRQRVLQLEERALKRAKKLLHRQHLNVENLVSDTEE